MQCDPCAEHELIVQLDLGTFVFREISEGENVVREGANPAVLHGKAGEKGTNISNWQRDARARPLPCTTWPLEDWKRMASVIL